MIRRAKPIPLVGRALILLLAAAAPYARAADRTPVSGWVFDRLTFSPGGDSLAVSACEYGLRSGRWTPAGESMTLLVDLATGARATPPEARAFQLGPGGGEALLLGTWGLWHLDTATGAARQIFLSSPAGGARIYDFAFDDRGRPLFLVGAVGDTVGGLFRPGAHGLPEKIAAFTPGSADVPPEWTSHARSNPRPQVEDARGPRFFVIDGFPGDFRYDGRTLTGIADDGAPAVIADSVEIAWASWPDAGGAGLVCVDHPEDGTGAVYRLLPGRPARRILDRTSPQVAWAGPGTAYLNDTGGRLFRYDADTDALLPVRIGALPAWTESLSPPEDAPVLAIDRWPLSAPDEASRRALLRKCAKDLGDDDTALAAVVRAGEGDPEGGIIGSGFFPSLGAANDASPAFEKRGLKVHPSTVPVRTLWGAFDHGFLAGPDGAVAFVRRPAENRPFTEVWLRRSGEPPRRLLSTRIG